MVTEPSPSMRLALMEYLTAGGRFGDQPASDPMAAQGIAMLLSAARDLSQFFSLVIPLSDDCPAIPTIDVDAEFQVIESNQDASEVESQWQQIASTCDAALVIAPETDGILERLLGGLGAAGVPLLNCDPQFVACASDKLRTALFLETAGVATPKTVAAEDVSGERQRMWLQKPRFGCGSEGIAPLGGGRPAAGNIVQPFIAGAPVGCGIVAGASGSLQALTPLIQRLRRGGFDYQGSDGPIADPQLDAAVRDLACQAVGALPGQPLGYLGVDLVLPPNGPPTVLEINPRYTASVQYLPLPDRNQIATTYHSAAKKLLRDRAG